ncbi:MAG TPA: hypothetical protein PKA41_06115 [Verrucomicrobiota bacterium]|nr:hypothetical protein [Verrucomicrobiota bacterium]
MNKLIATLAAVFATAVLAITVHATEKASDAAKLVSAVMPALVQVQYHLQFDKADAPAGGLGNERCPGCGKYHGDALKKYLDEERPVETAGFLIAPDRVVTVDPLIHPRFIKSITVKYRDASSEAAVAGLSPERKAAVLTLSKPLSGAVPLKFGDKTADDLSVIYYGREGGKWVAQIHPFPKNATVPDSGEPYRLMMIRGVVVNADGVPVGVVQGSRLPLDNSWQGSPMDWKLVSSDNLAAQLSKLESVSRAGLVRVSLGFRSPKGGSDASQAYRYRRGMMDDDDEDGSTQRNVLGLLLPGNKVLVLANFKARVTARLERITVHPAEGDPVEATFDASLKNFGAFVATLEKPLPGEMKMSAADLLALREKLLLRADVSVQGETRTDYFQTARIATCKVGPREHLYPELDEPEAEDAFLFTTDHELLALPVAAREQISGGQSQSYSYSQAQIELTPSVLLTAAVAGLPDTADASNAPMSEEDENRLAWLGVELQPLNRELARANGVADQTRDGETGALVTFVHPDSPAAKAGVEAGCVLLRLQVPGQALPVEVQIEEDYMRAQAFPWDRLDEVSEVYFERIPTPWPAVENEFVRALTDLGFGTRYTAEFFVDGKLVTKDFEVVAGPPHFDAASRYKSESVGVTVRDLTYDVRRYLQRKTDEPGVVISKVETGSKASVAGIKPYELITDVNDQPVHNVKDFERLTAAGGELKLSVKRMAKGRIVTVNVGGN